MTSDSHSELILVTTTTTSKEEALSLCKQLIEDKLIACAQCLGPITSHYIWENVYTESEEWQCQFKTREALFTSLEKRLKELHSYSTPEIIATSIIAVSNDYLTWVKEATKIS